MKKNILLVIFFFAIIFCILIYKISYKEKNNILFVGEYDDMLVNDKHLETFLYDNITYKELINMIKRNDYYFIKNKRVYLNQLIGKSDKIIIKANDIEYKKKCKNHQITNRYIKTLEIEKNELKSLISRFSNAEIIYLKSEC